MSAHLNEDMTCNAAFLAVLFNCTKRNIGHFIDRGMPVLEMGKAGREHVFKGPWAVQWFLGMKICERLGKPLPGPLETVLLGRFNRGSEDFGSFNACQRNLKKLAKEMGYSARQYDGAVDYLLVNQLLRW